MKLGDIAKVYGGYAFKSSEFKENGTPIIRIGNLDGDIVNLDDSICYSEDFLIKHPEFIVNKGDILVAMSGATVGKIGVYKNDLKALLNQRVGNIKPIGNLNKKLIFYYCKSPSFMNHIKKEAFGCAQPNISSSKIEDFVLNLPSEEKQNMVVEVLDKASKSIELKKLQLSAYDQFIKSRFVEMFGNLIDTVRLGDCCKVHARIGWQALTTAEHMQTGDYLLITGTDFKDNEVNYSTCKYVAKERYEMDDKIIIRNDDILITKDGTIGKVAIVHNLPKPATLNSGIFVVRPDQRFNKEYISYVFRGPLFDEFVEKTKTGATIKHLNQGHLVNFLIPLPSIEEQISFANFSIQIDKLKFSVQKSLEETKKLFDSLMQKYFG